MAAPASKKIFRHQSEKQSPIKMKKAYRHHQAEEIIGINQASARNLRLTPVK